MHEVYEMLAAGGAVMPPLVGLAALMWYGVGYRWLTLRWRVVDRCRYLAAAERNLGRHGLGDRVRIRLLPHRDELAAFAGSVRTAVVLAPLLGLLGTVGGMIETFDSLQSMAMFTQGGGIAAGISQALFTTQLGLVVAVPGHVTGRLLDRRQQQLEDAIDELLVTATAEAS